MGGKGSHREIHGDERGECRARHCFPETPGMWEWFEERVTYENMVIVLWNKP